METNQVTEHLQVIRTLMERSALYRRALATIMIYCGAVGIVAGIAGWLSKLGSDRGFVLFWSGMAMLALIGALILVRRQALKDAEPFWSSPTRRVTQALLPPLFLGCFINVVIICVSDYTTLQNQATFVAIWAGLYGCAIHSAGFFTPRGIRLFGWILIAASCGLFLVVLDAKRIEYVSPHILMGGVFGGLHLAYGVYLYFTENRKSAP